MVTESNINLTRAGTGLPFLVVKVVYNSESTLRAEFMGHNLTKLHLPKLWPGGGHHTQFAESPGVVLGHLGSVQPP